MHVPSNSDLLHDLLVPSGRTATLQHCLDRHCRQDIGRLQESSEPALSVAQTEEVARRLAKVSGCGGLHFLRADTHEVQRLRAELWMGAGRETELECPPGSIDLPVAGVTLDSSTNHPWVLRFASDEIIAITGPNRARLIVGDGGQVEHHEAHGPVSVSFGTTINGIRIAQGCAWARAAAPPQTRVYDRRLTPEDASSIDTASTLLRESSPLLWEEVTAEGQTLVPLERLARFTRQSASVRRLPGVVYATVDQPFELVDLLCHEYNHLKLFLFGETLQLLNNPTAPSLSPFRRDMRTAEGVLHAVFVFHHVARLFDEISKRHRPTPAGGRRRVVWRVCIEEAIALLRASEWSPTEPGLNLIAAIEAENCAGIQELSRGTDPAEVRSAVRAHIAQAGRPDSAEAGYFV